MGERNVPSCVREKTVTQVSSCFISQFGGDNAKLPLPQMNLAGRQASMKRVGPSESNILCNYMQKSGVEKEHDNRSASAKHVCICIANSAGSHDQIPEDRKCTAILYIAHLPK